MAPEETQGPEEHCKADRGETKLDQQRQKRIETELDKLVEMESNIKTEIKKLRTELVQDGQSMNKTRAMLCHRKV